MNNQASGASAAEPIDESLRLSLDEFSGNRAVAPVLNQFRLPDLFYTAEVKHPAFKAAVGSIMQNMTGGGMIILCAGPTGAGKSHLRRHLLRLLLQEHRHEMMKDRGFCPVIDMDAPVSKTTAYMWAPLFRDAFAAMGNPLPLNRYGRKELGDASGSSATIGNQDYEQLQRMFVATMRQRRCRCVILDEAQQLLGDREDLDRNLNMLKLLVEQTQAVWVLFGTYRQLDMLGQLSELVRRTAAVELPRYNITKTQADRDAFRGLLTRFTELALMPGLKEVTRDHPKLLYTGSFGIFGFLRRWIIGACVRAKMTGRPVSAADFEATSWRAADLLKLLTDIEAGEKRFADSLEDRKQLEARLGFTDVQDGPGFLSDLAEVKVKSGEPETSNPAPPSPFVESSGEVRQKKEFPAPANFRKSLGVEGVLS